MVIIMAILKPIETAYAGCRFRSRLEARWAVFFDSLGVRWEYEKEGYELPSGWYLPDFWLPDNEFWVEIKGKPATKKEFQLAKELAAATGKITFIFDHGIEPFSITDDSLIKGSGYYVMPDGDCDGMMYPGICATCQKFVIGHLGSHAVSYSNNDPECIPVKTTNSLNQVSGTDHPKIIKAYNAARSARFEFGEKGSH